MIRATGSGAGALQAPVEHSNFWEIVKYFGLQVATSNFLHLLNEKTLWIPSSKKKCPKSVFWN